MFLPQLLFYVKYKHDQNIKSKFWKKRIPSKKSDSQINMRGGFFSKFTENRLEINICK